MNGAGRPLRFLGLVLGGWVTLRVLWLWSMGMPLVQAIHHTIAPVLPPPEFSEATPPLSLPRPLVHGRATVPVAVPVGPPPVPTMIEIEPSPSIPPARAMLASLARSEFGPVVEMTGTMQPVALSVDPAPGDDPADDPADAAPDPPDDVGGDDMSDATLVQLHTL